MRRALGVLALAAASAVATACDKGIIDAGNGLNVVSMRDQCDPSTFNASLGAGTCTRQGNTTVTEFTTELTNNGRVAAWQYIPPSMTIHVGESITARNDGGEAHTFTRVAQFAGGVVIEYNQASNNLVAAPECVVLSSTDRIAPGAAFTTPAATAAGVQRYQCCIHPWMREIVTVQ